STLCLPKFIHPTQHSNFPLQLFAYQSLCTIPQSLFSLIHFPLFNSLVTKVYSLNPTQHSTLSIQLFPLNPTLNSFHSTQLNSFVTKCVLSMPKLGDQRTNEGEYIRYVSYIVVPT